MLVLNASAAAYEEALMSLLLAPEPVMPAWPTARDVTEAAALSGWLPDIESPWLRPVLQADT